MRINIKAHAKINWALNILARRDDGYHELDMLMQSIELFDEISFEEAHWLSLSVNGGAQRVNERNLIIRAANALNDYSGHRRGARINVNKYIPMRAGLGGGSADCAAALIALNRLWGLNLSTDVLSRIGAKLGADVPFCLRDGLAQVSGIGERIISMPVAPTIPLVLITPGDGLSTAQVFTAWDEGNYPTLELDVEQLAEALARRDLAAVQQLSTNALLAPAVEMMPEIQTTMEAMRKQGAEAVFMTGSGSTVVGAFQYEECARRAAKQLPNAVFTRTMSLISV